MYSIHTTPGFIIDSRATGEAGKVLSIFTRDLGLVSARAEGIRLEKSKLRYHAQDYSFGIFSFVKGKEFWRITSAQKESTQVRKAQGASESQNKSGQELIARLALLLKRLLHGEEAHPELFQIVESCAEFLAQHADLNDEHLKTLESVVVLRMLHALGYVGSDKTLQEYFNVPLDALPLREVDAIKRSLINQHINKALKESHL